MVELLTRTLITLALLGLCALLYRFEQWLVAPPPEPDLIGEAYSRGWMPPEVEEVLNMTQETEYDDLVEEKARQFRLDPKLLKAVIKVESNFNSRAHRHEPWVAHLEGPDCSFGLMQLLESTARELGHRGAARDLYHPAVNIHYGAMYLRKQLDRYGGDEAQAVAAYNAGSARYNGIYFRNQNYVDKVYEAMEAAL